VIAGSLALVASAFLHAAWNALLKRERDPQVAVAGVLAAALAVAVAAAWASPGPAFPTQASLGWALAAGILEALYFVTLAGALARGAYGVVYTVARGGALLLVWPAAALLLGEGASGRVLAGAAAVLLGLALVAAGGASRQAWGGVGWAAACAASIAGYHLAYERSLRAGAAPAPLFALALGVAMPVVVALSRYRGAGLRAFRDPRTAARWLLAGVLCTASFLPFLRGLGETGPAVALTLRNTAVVFAQALALAIGERVPPRQAVGALLVAAGATAVAWR
jgi:drug/metabolite transporter (DMT)-like permease